MTKSIESPVPKKIRDKLLPNEIRLLIILALIQFTHVLDFMIIMPLGAKFMAIFSISPQQFSFIVACYSIAAFVGSFTSAFFIDRFDRKKALLVFYLGFTLGTIACSFAPSYPILLLARMLTGAFGGVLGALVLSIIGDAIPLSRRGRAMSIVMNGFSAASVLGVPTGIYLAALWNWNVPFLAIGILSFFILGAIFLFVPSMNQHLVEHKVSTRPYQAIWNIIKDKNQLNALLFNVILMLGHFTIIPFIAPYMELNIGFSQTQVPLIYLIGGMFTVLVLPLFGWLSDKYGHALIFTIVSLGAVCSIFAITNLPVVSVPLALMVTSTFFITASGRNVPALTLITSVVKPESRGSFMSIRSSINEASLAVSTLISGGIIAKDSTGALLNYPIVGYVAMAMSLLAIVAARRITAID
jgi:predicted MFS family arabinose efflux permease